MKPEALADYRRRSAQESAALGLGLFHGVVLSLLLWAALLWLLLLLR